MLMAVVVAAGVVSGAPWWLPVGAWLVFAHPGAALAVAAGWVVWGRRSATRGRAGPDDEAVFLRSLAAELTAGASLRSALAAAVGHAPRLDLSGAARAAVAGLPAPVVARMLGKALPVNGRAAAATWLLASESGGPAATMMQSLALRAGREGELLRERRALTAQARASAWVVAGLPALLLAGLVISGRLSAGDDPVVGLVVAVGVVLQVLGVASVVAMVKRAEA
ncbi:MAG: type II secretion system F family protein [Acidimicrobiia bacterium]|nr:MAG: type II secretion system F family protein [Acidimicrobiia bacterium]